MEDDYSFIPSEGVFLFNQLRLYQTWEIYCGYIEESYWEEEREENIIMGNTKEENIERALELCKGFFQLDVINQKHTLGGSTLKGKERRFFNTYFNSVCGLLTRLEKNRIPFKIIYGRNGGLSTALLEILPGELDRAPKEYKSIIDFGVKKRNKKKKEE